jgi:hypothetical protein
MPRRLAPFAAAALLAVLWSAASQAAIWRCGPEGRSFTDRPCPGGTPVAVAPAPDAQRLQEAQVVAQRQAALAGQLRAERLAREAAWQQALQEQARIQLAARREAERQARRAAREARAAAAEDRPHGHAHGHKPGRGRTPEGAGISPAETRQAVSPGRPRPADARTSAAAAHASR